MYIMLSICFYCFSYADDGLDIQNVQINYFLLNDVSNRLRYPVFKNKHGFGNGKKAYNNIMSEQYCFKGTFYGSHTEKDPT